MSLMRRRLLLVTTAVTAAGSSKDKKPIYSALDQPIELVQTQPSALEYNIALSRMYAEKSYSQSHKWIKDRVGEWIALEEKVEQRIKSFKSPTEPLTPGALYVLTSTLFGSVIARSSVLLRFTLPPALFFASAFRFLPESSANVSNYVYDLERQYTPELARLQIELSRTARKGWQSTHDGWLTGKQLVEAGVRKSAGWISDATGLKVREVFGVVRHTTTVTQEQAAEGIQVMREKAENALENRGR